MIRAIAVILRIISQFFIKIKLFFIANLFSSIRASLLLKKFVKVKFDGQDWIYKWNNSASVSSVCYYNPVNNYSDLDLFFYKYKPNQNDIIIDIGVENGSEIPEFCKAVGASGKVIAVEADPSCCRRIKKLKKILNLNNLTIIEHAVGDINKKVKFLQEKEELQNRVIDKETNTSNYIEINQTTLNDILKKLNLKKINFIKVNIEGAEINLLKPLYENSFDIQNWCIGCHDFKGVNFRTYDFVKNWLINNKYKVTNYEPQKNKTFWRNYYLYGSKN